MPKLTKRITDAAVPKAQEFFIWDSELRGFGLRVSPSGHRSFLVQYRARGRTRRVRIGPYGILTVDDARRKAWALLNGVQHGDDPAEARAIDRKAITLGDFIEKVYLPDTEKGLVTYRGKPKKASTLAVDKGRITRHILPLLGARKVKDIRPGDITDFIEDVAAGKTATDQKTKARGRARVSGGPGTALRTVGLLGGIFSHAVRRRVVDINPVRGLDKRFTDKRRNRALAPEEYARLGDVLLGSAEHPSAIAAIRFLALSGFRKGEAQSLRRTEIDCDRSFVALRDSKTGPQSRALGQSALDVAKLHPDGTGPHIFWGLKPGKPFVGIQKVFERVCKEAELEDVTLHTLRHSFASVAAELGYSEFVIAGLLGHRIGSVTARYSHLPDKSLIAAANAVGIEILTRMNALIESR
jgi:integrase